MSRRILLLVNPISGHGDKSSVQARFEARMQREGFPYDILPTSPTGDYSHAVESISRGGTTDIVIAGGDGTVNGVLAALRHLPVIFAILPCGSGNGLAFGARIPKNIDAALEVAIGGEALPTDAFTVNGIFSCMLSGLGFDAQVAHDFAADPARGLATYAKKTFAHLFVAKAYPFSMEVDGQQLHTEAMFVSVANSNQFGNGFTIAPRASLSDGLLDVVVVHKAAKLGMLAQTLRQTLGYNPLTSFLESSGPVRYFHTAALHIHNPAGAPLHIDGDPAATAEWLEIKVLPGAYRLRYPARPVPPAAGQTTVD